MTQYYNFQKTCPICSRSFQRFTYKILCNGRCGREFCANHVPLQNRAGWICPDCKAAQAPFLSQPRDNAPSVGADPEAAATSNMIQQASALYHNQRTAEADRLLDDIFVSIFEKR